MWFHFITFLGEWFLVRWRYRKVGVAYMSAYNCGWVGVNSFKGRRWLPSGHRHGDWSIWSGMTAQSGHVKSVRSATDVSHDGRPNLPDVRSPGGVGQAALKNPTHVHFKPQTLRWLCKPFALCSGLGRGQFQSTWKVTEPNWYLVDFKASVCCTFALVTKDIWATLRGLSYDS